MNIYVDGAYSDGEIVSTVLYDYKLYKFEYNGTLQIEGENINLSAYVAELLALYMAFKIIENKQIQNVKIFTDNLALYGVLNGNFNTKNILTYKLLNYFKFIKNKFSIQIEKVSSGDNLADLDNIIFVPLQDEICIEKDFFKQIDLNFVDLTIDDVYQVYNKAKKGKSNRKDFMEFEINLQENIERLFNGIVNRTYLLGRYKCFIKQQRKYREIFMLDVEDIIIQHLILQKIANRFEKSFIYDSWNHRLSKGTHSSWDRLKYFIRSSTNNFDEEVYFMKMDIKGFFFNINRGILRRILFEKVQEPYLRYLLDQFLLTDAREYFEFINGTSFEDVKKLKRSLFKVKKGKGLPLGNVISQFFASVYLDKLDKFVKHKLKIRYYLRYADDIVILHQDKEQSKQWKQEIKKFLKNELDLSLSVHKTYIRHTKKGIRWLGKRFFRWNKEKLLSYHYENFNKNMNKALMGKKSIYSVLNGYSFV